MVPYNKRLEEVHLVIRSLLKQNTPHSKHVIEDLIVDITGELIHGGFEQADIIRILDDLSNRFHGLNLA